MLFSGEKSNKMEFDGLLFFFEALFLALLQQVGERTHIL